MPIEPIDHFEASRKIGDCQAGQKSPARFAERGSRKILDPGGERLLEPVSAKVSQAGGLDRLGFNVSTVSAIHALWVS